MLDCECRAADSGGGGGIAAAAGIRRQPHRRPPSLDNPPGYDEHLYRRDPRGRRHLRPDPGQPLRDIERTRGQRDWEEFDRDLDLALKYEQEPIVLIANTPGWASVNGQDTHEYPYKTELLPDFTDFCADLAKRTKGKAKFFQLWNEPNGCGWHCADGFNHTDEYFPVLAGLPRGHQKGQPRRRALARRARRCRRPRPHLRAQTYEEKAKAKVEGRLFDAVSDHPYSTRPRSCGASSDALHQLLASHGDGDLPFWNTEYGWTTGEMKADDQAETHGQVPGRVHQARHGKT